MKALMICDWRLAIESGSGKSEIMNLKS